MTGSPFYNYVMPDDLNALDVDKVALIPLVDYEKHYAEIPREKMVLPYITNISKGEEDQFIEAHFDAICEHYRDRGIYIGNLSWLLAFFGGRGAGLWGLRIEHLQRFFAGTLLLPGTGALHGQPGDPR